MKQLTLLFALVAVLLLPATATHALPLTFKVDLDGPSEAPPNPSPGTGFGTVTIDTLAHTMGVDVTFKDLSGIVTASHIHCCVAVPGAGTAGVATPVPTFPGFPSGVSAGSYSSSFDLTLLTSYNPSFVTSHGGTAAGAEAALVAGIEAGKAYWNIHTNLFPGGEIRGFLAPVPEPATLLLFGSGLAGLGGLAWRRNRK